MADILLKDVIHLYLGCEVILQPDNPKLRRVGTFVGFNDYPTCMSARIAFRAGPEGAVNILMLKPALRPLSDMTEGEAQECGNLDYDFTDDPDMKKFEGIDFLPLLTPNQFLWLIKRGFDLFGLIESNQAIDKTTLK